MKAEEFVKTFTKEEILNVLFRKNCLNERSARNLCVALLKWNKVHPGKNQKAYENLYSSRKTLKN